MVKCPKAVIFMSPELSSWISVVKCPFFFRSTPSLAAGLVPYCRIRKIVEACRNYSGSLLGNWSRGSFLTGEVGTWRRHVENIVVPYWEIGRAGRSLLEKCARGGNMLKL